MSCKHPVRTKWHTAIMGFHSQTEISKPLTAALNLQMFAVCTLCWGMQSIEIPVSKSAFCGAYNALWSQSSNSGITGDIRLPSNSGVILHWCHCCDLSTESKPMDKSKSLVRFFTIEESYFWRVKASHMQKFPGLLLSVIKVVALFDLMFCRLKLHRLETLNWTVHGSHLSSSSPQACCSLNEDTLDYVSRVPSYIITAYSCHFQKCDRNSQDRFCTMLCSKYWADSYIVYIDLWPLLGGDQVSG
jgi:hypothetical protein